MIDVSIIIPVYNSCLYLEECISSLYRQGLHKDKFEIILIDDGSKDDSLLLAKELAAKCGNIRVFHQENQGQAVARNLGLEMAKGKYLMFVDSDDYLLDDGVKHLYDVISDSDLDIVFGFWNEENKNGDVVKKNSKGFTPNMVYSGEELVLNYPIFGSVCGGIYKKDVFEGLRFEKGITHEDSELCFRLFPRVRKIMLIEQPVYFYRYNPASTDREMSKIKLLRNVESDAIISSKIRKNISRNLFNDIVSKKYKRIANSMVVSYFMQLRKNELVSAQEFNERIKNWIDMGIYPIRGVCNSWVSSLIAQLFNRPYILRKFICN